MSMSDQIDHSPKGLGKSADPKDNANRVDPVNLPADDPLADLIKLIQQEDPFKDVENIPAQAEPDSEPGANLHPVQEKSPLTLEEIEAAIAAATEPGDAAQAEIGYPASNTAPPPPVAEAPPAKTASADVAYVPPVLEVPPSRPAANAAPVVQVGQAAFDPEPEEQMTQGVDPFDLDSALQEFRDSDKIHENEFHSDLVVADIGSYSPQGVLPEPSEFNAQAVSLEAELKAIARSVETPTAHVEDSAIYPEPSTPYEGAPVGEPVLDSVEERSFGSEIVGATDGQGYGSAYDDPAFEEYDPPEYQADGDFDTQTPAASIIEPQRKKHGGIFAVGLLIGLVLIAGVMYFTFQSPSGPASDGEVPFLQANSTPLKETPENPGGQEIANQDRLVYNGEENTNSGSQERLVSREEPVEQIPKTEPKDDSRPNAVTSVLPPAAAVPISQARATIPPPSATAAPAPRRVRTVVVRPDGTVVSNPTPAPAPTPTASPTPAPAPTPAPTSINPVSPPAATANNGVPLPLSRPVQIANANPGAGQVTAPVQPVAQNVPATPTRQANAPVRITPPSSPVVNSVPPQQVAAVGPTLAPTPAPAAIQSPSPAPTSVASSGQYVVQVAARRSEEQALGAFEQMKSQFRSAIGNYGPLIQRADLGDRGVYYRLRLGPMSSQSEANQVCSNLKAAGLGDCLVRPL
jgi:sporulation related protein